MISVPHSLVRERETVNVDISYPSMLECYATKYGQNAVVHNFITARKENPSVVSKMVKFTLLTVIYMFSHVFYAYFTSKLRSICK